MLPLFINEVSANYLGSGVMIVDDQSVSLNKLGEIVSTIDNHLHIDSYNDPKDALLTAKQRPPELIITDYMTPAMNGIEFSQHNRTLPGCQDTPISMINVMNEKVLHNVALELGMTVFSNRPLVN